MTPASSSRRPLTAALWGAVPPFIVLATAAVLRVLYLLITPFHVREHDVNGHIQYIEYVAENWTIPVAGTGWEFHQQPLYYFLNAPFFLALKLWFGLEHDGRMFGLQWLSFAMSMGIVLLCFDIARTMLRDRKIASILFCLLIATSPGLIILSQGINNDSLFSLLSFAVFAAILRYWKKGTSRDWYRLVVLFLLAALTKASAILFAPVIGCVFVLKEWPNLRALAKKAAVSIAILVPLYAWLPAIRHIQGASGVLPTADNLSADVILPSTWTNFLTFNPVAMVAIPFVSAHDDMTRRMYFWEYLYRSSFFGEWGFADSTRTLATVTLATGLLVLALSLAYSIVSVRKHFLDHLPVWLTTACLFAALVYYRLHNPCSCNQDFRFIPLVAGTMALAALSWNPRSLAGRAIVYVPASVLCILQASFILSLYALAA